MIYIYSKQGCLKCEQLKQTYDVQGIHYIEREATRLEKRELMDDIDVDGFIQLQNQHGVLPVEVTYNGQAKT